MGRVDPGPRARIALVLASATLVGLVACAGTRDGTVHVLQSGETIYRLSRYYGVPVRDIVRANDIDDVSAVPVGSRLLIPGTSRAAPDRTIALASVAPGGARTADDLAERARREASLQFGWPLRGKLSSGFGRRRGRSHEGIDIAAKKGSPIRAAEAGRVIHSGWLGDYGRVVIVKHAGRYSSVYAHNRTNRVRRGAFVEKGEVLAEVGTSGNASGPHLHFEIRRDRRPQDPMRFLR